MTTARFTLLFALFLLLANPVFSAGLPKDIADDYWMGIYLGDTKFGYVHTIVKQDTFEGKPVIVKQDEMLLRSKKGDDINNLKLKLTQTFDEEFRLLLVTFAPSYPDSGEQEMGIQMRFGKDYVEMTPLSDDGPSLMNVPLDEKDIVMLTSGAKYDLGHEKLNVGSKSEVKFLPVDCFIIDSKNISFNYGTVAMDLEVIKEEMLPYSGKSVRSLVVRQTNDKEVSTRWYSTTGQLYKIQHEKSNLVFLREPMKTAMDIGDGLIRQPSNTDESESPRKKPANTVETVLEPRKNLDLSQDYWLGAYCEGIRIGYLHIETKLDTYEGKKVVARTEHLRFRVKQGDEVFDKNLRHTLYMSDGPVAEIIVYDRNKGGTSTIKATFSEDMIEIQMTEDSGKPTRMSVPTYTSQMRRVTSGFAYHMGLAELHTYDTFIIWRIGQSKLNLGTDGIDWGYKLQDSSVEVLREEKLETGERLLVVIEKNDESLITKWFDEAGRLYKQSSDKSNISFIREPKEKALSIEDGEPPVVAKFDK